MFGLSLIRTRNLRILEAEVENREAAARANAEAKELANRMIARHNELLQSRREIKPL